MRDAASRTTFRLQGMVLLAGLVLMGLKFLAWLLTNSNAVLADAVELFVHADPCLPPDYCAIGQKDDCPDRRQPKQDPL